MLYAIAIVAISLLSHVNAFQPNIGFMHTSCLRVGYRGAFSSSKSRLNQLINDNIREKLLIPSDRVIEAIELIKERRQVQNEKNSLSVSVSDIASVAAVDFSTAKQNLITLALLTEGDLDVTNDGEVIYSFPVNFKSILYQKSLINKLRRIYLNYIEPPLAYSVRISFGVMLLTSLAIIFTTFVAVSTSSSSDRDRDRDERNSPNRLNIWLGNSPFDLFYYRNSGGMSSNFDEQVIDYYRDQEVTTKHRMGFLESFYSYIFGDGNPNEKLSLVSLQSVASVIRKNNGTVTAEQIAPYLNPPNLEKYIEANVVDESFVLPVLLTYDGIPNVLPSGDIVYTFPDLMITTTGVDNNNNQLAKGLGESLYEKKIPLSLAPSNLRLLAGALGIVNLLGVLKLQNLMNNTQLLLVNPTLFTVLTKLFPFLFTYALLYNAIPLFRYLRNKSGNQEIEERNRNRLAWAKYLKAGGSELIKKLNLAQKYQQKKVIIDEQGVVYTTKRPET